MPRIPPITGKADVALEHQPMVDAVLEVFGAVRGPFSMLLHSPALAELMLPLVPYFREGTVVEARLRLLAILATVREREAEYVWAAQVGAARRFGVREAAIDVLRAKGDPAALEPDECDVVIYARQLARTNRVEQAVFDRLLARFGKAWLVELTAAASFYGALCGIANAFEVPALPEGDRY